MRLPSESELTNPTFRELYEYDVQECFPRDQKGHWAIYYQHRLETILKAVENNVPIGGTVLDLGCAQATAALLLAEKGYRVTAVDARSLCLDYARLRYERGDIRFVCGDITRVPIDKQFDAVLLGEVLEHVPRPGKLLTDCLARLNEGGILVATTPNGIGPLNWLLPGYDPDTMENEERDALSSGLGGNETHLFCFRLGQLRRAVVSSGFTLECSGYLNSCAINKIGLHHPLPLPVSEWLNRTFSRIPVLAMTMYVVARKPTVGHIVKTI